MEDGFKWWEVEGMPGLSTFYERDESKRVLVTAYIDFKEWRMCIMAPEQWLRLVYA